MSELEKIRIIAAELCEEKGGHSGINMGAPGIMLAMWKNYIYDFENYKWENRDYLVFSSCHGILLQYIVMYLDEKISYEDLISFRESGSKFKGLSERQDGFFTEVTTGALGQGIGTAVGIAYGLKSERKSNKVMCLLGDGCLMEGLSYEAMSFAGANKLSNLIVLYDSNNATIDGCTTGVFEDDIELRVKGSGWDYHYIEDGDNYLEIEETIRNVTTNAIKPTLIEVKTILARGCKFGEGNSKYHGTGIGMQNIHALRTKYNYETILDIKIEREEYTKINDLRRQKVSEYVQTNDEKTEMVVENMNFAQNNNLTLIELSGKYAKQIVELNAYYYGSADLLKSTRMHEIECEKRNIRFGIREHAMTAISNGVYLATNQKVICSTYLAFSDYMKPALRMSSIMKIPNIYILTHDGNALESDGVTHLPVEQVASLHATPNLEIWRPCSEQELVCAWNNAILSKENPTAIVLSREKPINLYNSSTNKGGYVLLKNTPTEAEICIIASGAAIHKAIDLYHQYVENGYKVQLASIPCIDVFNNQTTTYIQSVIPENSEKVYVEVGSSYGKVQYKTECVNVISKDTFEI